jgi:Archaeal fructose-1,6-bisphosphatase and related enzymes of inositol monophosphatase family
VSIALEHKGEIVAAVVFDPAKDEMFTAEKGGGCWLNDSRLRVSGRRKLIEALFATGLPFGGREDLPDTLQDLARIMPVCSGVRRWGAAALALAYVAAGRYDGFWERRLHAWDIAAGVLLVREAGGLIEPLEKDGDIMRDGDLITANEQIFESFARIIRND